MPIQKFKQLNTNDDIINRLQDNVSQALASISPSLIIDGFLLSSIALPAGTIRVNHKLGRVPLGAIVVSSSATSIITVNIPASNAENMLVTSSVAVTASFWMF